MRRRVEDDPAVYLPVVAEFRFGFGTQPLVLCVIDQIGQSPAFYIGMNPGFDRRKTCRTDNSVDSDPANETEQLRAGLQQLIPGNAAGTDHLPEPEIDAKRMDLLFLEPLGVSSGRRAGACQQGSGAR